MVMKKNVTRINLFRTIRRSFARYLAIALIIALGSSMFVGLLSTKTDMVATGQEYLRTQNMFDLRLLSTYGWTQKEVDAVAAMPGITAAEGQISIDAVMYVGKAEKGAVYQLHAIPETINRVYLLGGRMPQSPDECLIDGFHVGDEVLGTKIVVGDENEENTLDMLSCRSFTVVGYVSSPLYMDMSRGSTSLGNGMVTGYLYMMPQAFDTEIFTEIAVTMQGSYDIYSDAFTAALEAMAQQLEPQVTVLAQDRFANVLFDAEQAYQDGLQEYEDGYAQFREEQEKALQQLEEAFAELTDNQNLIDENRASLLDGLEQVREGQETLDAQAALLASSRQEFLAAKLESYKQLADAYAMLMDNYAQVTDGLSQVDAGLQQLDSGLQQIEEGILALEDGLQQIEDGLPMLELMIGLFQGEVALLEAALEAAQAAAQPDAVLIEKLTQELAVAREKLEEYVAQQQEALAMQAQCQQQLQQLQTQHSELTLQRTQLLQTKAELEAAMQQLQSGLTQLQGKQAQADLEFASAEAQLQSAQLQLDAAQAELDASRQQIEEGLAALEAGQAELDAGKAEYESAKAEAEQKFAEAEAELSDAAQQLQDAREQIDSMEEAQVYVLDRNTNAGYMALDNNSDIVSGVSRVLPAFFLLVAALVCITTMTRMVEEERTQIGTMKALGYQNGRIIRKYLLYAGSAAVIGCGLGTVLGSLIFPSILWEAYKIIFNITPRIVLRIDWLLCGIVVLSYTVVILLVTWYCCRMALRQVPAELIRPKAPAAGKKIWIERLPFWSRLSFLNKVMLRNVFRYRQRMLMMLVGVGGCTALLLCGFGLRDSLVNIVTDQFDKVTVYDMAVYFNHDQSPQEQADFRAAMEGSAQDVMFVYQTSAEIGFAQEQRELYLVVADEKVQDFIHFHTEDTPLPMPGLHEVLLSAGMARNLGIRTGDTVRLQDADHRILEVTVSGIYDNMVFNYAIVTPETYAAQLGQAPGLQMAFVNVQSGEDVYEVATRAGEQEGVLNVMISRETADQVTSMMDALDMLVVVIVVCAGALAVIVMYNLTNINITERIREIATIKVLGFHSVESALYVFKENLLLTGMGIVAGLVMGKYLLDFVISQINVDFVFFRPQISLLSCLFAIVLTILSALLVDLLLYFKLDKINMAEALKPAE